MLDGAMSIITYDTGW